MKTASSRFWIVVLLLGWTFDFLFWGKPAGVNIALFILLSLVTGILLLRAAGLTIAPRAAWLAAPIVLFAALTFIRLEPMSALLATAAALFLMGILALTYRSGEWIGYTLLDHISGYLRLVRSMIVRPPAYAAKSRNLPVEEASPGAERRGRFWPYVRGVALALPVIAMFAALLSSADPIFADRFQGLLGLFELENLPEYLFRLLFILMVAWALAGTFLHAADESQELRAGQTSVSPFLGFTEASIVLGSVLLLFLAFVIVQFRYFFGGQVNIGIEGYTYAEYARKGFGELVAVAFFSLLLLLGLGAVTRRATEGQRRSFSLLGVGLVSLLIVILVAAFQRLVLYEAAYGFSRLRTYTHVFMIWLGLLLVAVVVLEIVRRESAIGLAMIVAALGFVLSLNVLNVDAFIVNQNIQREIRSLADPAFARGRADLDAQYFLDLSDDAIPPLVREFQSGSVPGAVREKIGAALACKWYERQQSSDPLPWQGFHLSHWNADQAFDQVRDELREYTIADQDWQAVVTTPSGSDFACDRYFMD